MKLLSAKLQKSIKNTKYYFKNPKIVQLNRLAIELYVYQFAWSLLDNFER